MTKILILGRKPPRFARVRFGSEARDQILQFRNGRPLKDDVKFLGARIYVKDGTSPPLGDCPRSDEGIVLSKRACELLSPDEFQAIPVSFYGVGAEKRSGIWYRQPLESYTSNVEFESDYFFIHPIKTRLPDVEGITEPPDYPGDKAEGDLDLRSLSEWIAAGIHFQHNIESYLKRYFLTIEPPSIFAFGSVADVFFSEQFQKVAQENDFKGFTFKEVAKI